MHAGVSECIVDSTQKFIMYLSMCVLVDLLLKVSVPKLDLQSIIVITLLILLRWLFLDRAAIWFFSVDISSSGPSGNPRYNYMSVADLHAPQSSMAFPSLLHPVQGMKGRRIIV